MPEEVQIENSLSRDPDYPRLRERLIRETGLAWYADRQQQLCDLIEERFQALSLDCCEDYLNLIDGPDAGAAELGQFVDRIAVGETHFFRHSEQFEAICSTTIPDIIERNGSARTMRIWCAGCASGPEPYTLSILLTRRFRDAIRDWDVRIFGTDISHRFLDQARSATYGAWALRGTPEDVKRDCFENLGNSWRLREEFRRNVTFLQHNLVRDEFVADSNNGFDLIMCRNVFIYFDRKTTDRVITRLKSNISKDGWLAIGASDWSPGTFSEFETVETERLTLYRKPGSPRVNGQCPKQAFWNSKASALSTGTFEDFTPLEWPKARSLRSPAHQTHSSPPRDAKPVRPPPTLDGVEKLADSGAVRLAIEDCKRLIESDPLNARAHLLLSMLMERDGKSDEAELLLRRAIYLNASSPLAHYQLGLHFRRRGKQEQAKRSLRNALRLIESLPAEKELPDCDGLTVGQLSQALQIYMEMPA